MRANWRPTRKHIEETICRERLPATSPEKSTHSNNCLELTRNMETQTASIAEKIAELKQRYTRLALQCRAAGLRINAQTIAEYAQELQRLQTQAV